MVHNQSIKAIRTKFTAAYLLYYIFHEKRGSFFRFTLNTRNVLIHKKKSWKQILKKTNFPKVAFCLDRCSKQST